MNALEIINLVDDPLSALLKKGNIGYAEELYNPGNFFRCVHHISFTNDDKKIKFSNSTIKIHVLKTTRKFLPFLWVAVDFILCLAQIVYIARKFKVCLIRGRGPHYASLFGLLTAKILHLPLVVSIGGNHRLARDLTSRYPVFNCRPIDLKIEEIVLKNADKVICPNNFSKEYVKGLGAPENKAVVIPLRLKSDITDFTYKESDILTRNGVDISLPIVLFVGRFEKDKQVDVLIETIPLILAVYPKTQFVFIGNGSLLPFCKKRTEKLKVLRNVYFLGFQQTETIKYCLKAANLVWIAMSGFVIFEAAAASRPIVAFDVEWHSEFIENGRNGLLVKNRDRQKLSQAIVILLKDSAKAEKLGNNARKLLEEKYDPEIIVKNEISLLSDVIDNSKKVRKGLSTHVFN